MNQFSRNVALWLVLGLMFLLLFNLFNKQQAKEPEIIFSDFISAAEKGDVTEVTIQGSNIRGKYHNGERFKTFAPEDPDLVKLLREKGVKIAAKPEEGDPWYIVLFVQWFPMLLLIGVWIFFMRQMQVGGGKAMSFGKSRAKLLSENTTKVTFNDVSGIDEAKEELEEIIAFLKDPKKFTKLGGRIPKGVLLVGSPGTGKT
ncbi:MAG: ATP-dependent metallopeptidase FtsH/Yme1/Tma family protein, partial [Gaiellaceae bacterium]